MTHQLILVTPPQLCHWDLTQGRMSLFGNGPILTPLEDSSTLLCRVCLGARSGGGEALVGALHGSPTSVPPRWLHYVKKKVREASGSVGNSTLTTSKDFCSSFLTLVINLL